MQVMLNFAEEYEARRLCLLGGGGLGAILGEVGGAFLAPELLPGIVPAALAAGAGAELGGTVGGVLGGEPAGKAALGAIPGAATAGIGTGLANVAEGAGFLGSAVTPLSGVESLFGGGGGAAPAVSGADLTTAPGAAGAPVGGAAAPMAAPAPLSGAAGAGTSPASSALPSATDIGGAAGGYTPGVAAVGGAGQDFAGTAGLPADVPFGTGGITGTPSAGSSGGAGGGGFISNLVSGIEKNPGVLLAAGGLGLEAIKQQQPLPEQAQLNQLGATSATTGNELAKYLTTGTLPPGAAESIRLGTDAAKSQVRSTAAQLGLSGSTWEADKMAQIDQTAAAQSEQIAANLLQTGATYSQLSTQVYETLLRETLAQDQQFAAALGNFAGGLAGARLAGGATSTTAG